jgi:hypothetical protein
MGMLVARPISRRSEGRTFAVTFCAFTLSMLTFVVAESFMNSTAMPSFPIYPNATLVTSSTDRSASLPATTWLQATYSTADGPVDVQRFYEKTLWDKGWSKSLCGYYERRTGNLLFLRISTDNGKTTISISTGTDKVSCDYAGGDTPAAPGSR